MKKDFVATTESGEARHFTLETQGADEVIFTENGQSTAFKIVSQSASHWQLCDSAGQTFTFALAQASEKRFLQVGLKTQSFGTYNTAILWTSGCTEAISDLIPTSGWPKKPPPWG